MVDWEALLKVLGPWGWVVLLIGTGGIATIVTLVFKVFEYRQTNRKLAGELDVANRKLKLDGKKLAFERRVHADHQNQAHVQQLRDVNADLATHNADLRARNSELIAKIDGMAGQLKELERKSEEKAVVLQTSEKWSDVSEDYAQFSILMALTAASRLHEVTASNLREVEETQQSIHKHIILSLPRFGGHPERDYSPGSSTNAATKVPTRFIQERRRTSRDGSWLEDCRRDRQRAGCQSEHAPSLA